MITKRIVSMIVAGLVLLSLASAPVFAYSSEKLAPALEGSLNRNSNDLVSVTIHIASETAYDTISREVGSKIKENFYPDGFVAELTGQEIFELAERDEVALIEYSFVVEPVLQDAVNIVRARPTWAVQVFSSLKKVLSNDKRRVLTNLTGVGQTIAIVDTGIDFNHPALVGKNIFEGSLNLDCYNYDPCTLDPNVTDVNGHGTAMAAIAGASEDLMGVANGAKLISLKIYNGASVALPSSIVINRAIDWVTAHADEYNISVISFSSGTGPIEGYCDIWIPSTNISVNNALARNISFVASSGNDYSRIGIAYPACLPNAIPVGATRRDDTLAQFTNYNSLVKLFAPGTMVFTAYLNGGYAYYTGTSPATPMVSGAIAILNQFTKAQRLPAKNPKDIESILHQSGDPIFDLPSSYKRINIFNAGKLLDASACRIYFGTAVC